MKIEDVQDWNYKIYRDDNGEFVKKGELTANEFWNEFGIKSGPKFQDACWSHIPAKWANDVRAMLKQAQYDLGDRISFMQIKEKFCELTVYFGAKDAEAKDKMNALIKECQNKLREKGLHP